MGNHRGKSLIQLQRVYLLCFEESFERFGVSRLLPEGGENLCVPLLFPLECDKPRPMGHVGRRDEKASRGTAEMEGKFCKAHRVVEMS